MPRKTTIETRNEYVDISRIDDFINRLNCHDNTEKQWHDILKKLKKQVKNNFNQVKYDFKKRVGNTVVGRMYPQKDTCYATMNSCIRNYLIKDNYTSIDLQNCHPKLVRDLMRHFKIDCPEIEQYCSNRNAICEQYNIDKKFITSLINNNKPNIRDFYKKKGLFFYNLHCVIYDKLLPTMINQIEGFREIYDTCENNDNNKDGTFISLALQTIEYFYVHTAIVHLRNLEYTVDSYIYDGLLIGKSKPISNSDLSNLNDVLSLKPFKNIHFEPLFVIEEIEYTNQVQEIIDRPLPSVDKDDEPDKIETDYDVALTVYKEYSDGIKITSNSLIYSRWIDGSWRVMTDDIMNIYFQKMGFLVTKKYSHYRTQLKAIIQTREPDDKFFEQLDRYKDIIIFQNCYYDFNQSRFIEGKPDNIIYSKYISKKIDLDYEIDKEDYEFVDRLFQDWLGSAKSETLTFLVRALAGHVEDKNWLNLTGARNSGKGMINNLFLHLFPNMIGQINSQSLCVQKTKNPDVERSMGFIGQFVENRLVFTSEIEASATLDGTKIKQIASGGDYIPSYRSSYEKNKSGYISASLCIMAQSLPEDIKPRDCMQNLLSVNMPYAYVDNDTYERVKSSSLYKLANPEIKGLITSGKYDEVLYRYLFSFWKKNKPNYSEINVPYDDDNKDNMTEFEQFKELFDARYVIDYNEKIKRSEFNNYFKMAMGSITSQRINKYMAEMGICTRKIMGDYFFKGINERCDF